MKKTPLPKLKIEERRAFGSEAEQEWYFLDYPGEYQSYNGRWTIVRRYMANGDTWWGVRATFGDTHENGLKLIPAELKIATQALKEIKRNWKKYLHSTD